MSTEHPDEGTIHAWLDDALGADESARVAAHVASCVPCSAAVAEARGLIAGASRVVRGLDGDVRSPRLAEAMPRTSVGEGSLWRALRVTPARAAIAATLLVALGIGLTHDWVAKDSAVSMKAESMSMASSDSARPRDALLDSAIARNIAQALPPRTVKRAPGMDIPVPPPTPPAATALADPSAPMRVATARRSAQARRDTTVVADRAAVNEGRAVLGSAAALEAAPAVILRGRAASASAGVSAAPARAAPSSAGGGECLRIESATPGTRWGGATLPLFVALGTSGDARVLGAASADTLQARWQRTAGDSLRLAGATGTIELTAGDGVRSGTMRSAQQPTVAVIARRIRCP